MAGSVALHGGGEFLPGDEAFLGALLAAAARPADDRGGPDEPIRIAVMPTAAARHDPDAAARLGKRAFEQVAGATGRGVVPDTARVVDGASAADPAIAATLERADLIYLPGGDPDVIPTLLPDSAAWRAIATAHDRGAVLAGASAGAMGLCRFTWTPEGILGGLAILQGLVVFPHADATAWTDRSSAFAIAAAAGVGVLGLGERTGVISPPGPRSDGGGGTATWQVVGEGETRWLPPGASEPAISTHGDVIELPR